MFDSAVSIFVNGTYAILSYVCIVWREDALVITPHKLWLQSQEC